MSSQILKSLQSTANDENRSMILRKASPQNISITQKAAEVTVTNEQRLSGMVSAYSPSPHEVAKTSRL